MTTRLSRKTNIFSTVLSSHGLIGGGGGGRPDMAEAGGKDPSGLDDALAAAAGIIEQRMEASG